MSKRSNLFSALLKYWRGQRGFSQLDLGLTADVSARHISFLETARAAPSREMVLRLGQTLSLSLRQQNELLQSAGFEKEFTEPDVQSELPKAIQNAIERLKKHHDPYPLVVMNRGYDAIDMNQAAVQMAATFCKDLNQLQDMNAMKLLFDPLGFQPFVENFDEVGRELLWRLQREALEDPADEVLSTLVEDIVAFPTVKRAWLRVDLSRPSEPTLVVHLKREELRLSFFTMMTAFSAPQNVTVEELRIESYFPFDDASHRQCELMLERAFT